MPNANPMGVYTREFEINVSKYTSQELTKAMHWDELQTNHAVNIRIDYKTPEWALIPMAQSCLKSTDLQKKRLRLDSGCRRKKI